MTGVQTCALPIYPLARLYARTMIGRAVRKARRVLTVSETVKGEIEATFGARHVVVAPNGVDHMDANVRSADGPRPTANYFLYVGNDKPHKNVEALVDAAQRASEFTWRRCAAITHRAYFELPF